MLVCHRNQVVVVNAFDPSTREGGDILRFLETESPFQTEVEVQASDLLFCFSDLHLNLCICHWVFINHTAGSPDFFGIGSEEEWI